MSTKDIPESQPTAPLLWLGSSEGLGPLPEAGMTEVNPYRDMGPMDPHNGKEILTWYSNDQMRAYALQELAAERERWADKVMLKNLALMAAASLLERIEIADGGTYGDLQETMGGITEALRA